MFSFYHVLKKKKDKDMVVKVIQVITETIS